MVTQQQQEVITVPCEIVPLFYVFVGKNVGIRKKIYVLALKRKCFFVFVKKNIRRRRK